ncbi:hypothetical protein NHP200010_04220 [Helicobacter bizzozeronii]|nr:hypothetical protein NHP200010_04220 [Helicobacter bizzozeronii]
MILESVGVWNRQRLQSVLECPTTDSWQNLWCLGFTRLGRSDNRLLDWSDLKDWQKYRFWRIEGLNRWFGRESNS